MQSLKFLLICLLIFVAAGSGACDRNSTTAANSSKVSRTAISAQAKTIEAQILKNEVVAAGDLENISSSELRILRNLIFARHGKKYNSPELRDYYLTCAWYQPNPAYTHDWLSTNDKLNVQIILRGEETAKLREQTTENSNSQLAQASPAPAANTAPADSANFAAETEEQKRLRQMNDEMGYSYMQEQARKQQEAQKQQNDYYYQQQQNYSQQQQQQQQQNWQQQQQQQQQQQLQQQQNWQQQQQQQQQRQLQIQQQGYMQQQSSAGRRY